ncbi:MAG: hypothetical protein ACOH1Y_14275 [Propionicimonas sp.]
MSAWAPTANGVRHWLRTQHEPLPATITPDLIRDTYQVWGRQARTVLNAYVAGASPRFVAAYISCGHDEAHVRRAWELTQDAGLDEPAATGWALTGQLKVRGAQTTVEVITAWVTLFGPAAYLCVLAGYDLGEAAAIHDAGELVTEDQLRVMAALNGVVLPEGI